MDLIERALRRYEELTARERPQDKDIPTRERSQRKKRFAWVTEYVLPAVESITGCRAFQSRANGSRTRLARGAPTEERQALDAVALALRELAKHLLGVTQAPAVRKCLKAKLPPAADFQETISITAQGGEVVNRTHVGEIDVLERHLAQLETIATDRHDDLAYVEDAFGPQAGIFNTADEAPKRAGMARARRHPRGAASEAALMPFFNDRILPLGDFVVRCARERIECFKKIVASVLNLVLPCLQSLAAEPLQTRKTTKPGNRAAQEKMIATLTAAWQRVEGAATQFEAVVVHGKTATQREAAVVLTQVWVALRPRVDAAWLEPEARTLRYGRERLQGQLRGRLLRQTADLIASALHSIRPLTRVCQQGTNEFEDLVRQHDLAIRLHPPAVYWQGKPVKFDAGRHRQPWRFLVELVKQSKRRGCLTASEVECNEGNFASMKNRTVNLLPVALRQHIRQGSKKGSYRLDLPPDRIVVYQDRN